MASKKQERRILISRWMFWSSWVGFAVSMTMWGFNMISNRTMLGLTLALSWLALIYESFNAKQISD